MITTCATCGSTNDAHQGLTSPNSRPAPGDVSLCWGCGAIGIFTETGVRAPTDEEEAEISAAPEIQQARNALRESYTVTQAVNLYRNGARR